MIMKKVLFIMAVSAMAAGCADNSIPKAQLPELDLSNPLLAAWDTPHETPPFSEIKLADYEPAFDAAIACSRAEIDAIVNNPRKPTFGNTIVALERQGELLNRIAGLFFNLLEADTSDEMQEIAQRVQPKLTELSNDISLNPELFARVKQVYEHPGRLRKEDRKLLEDTYQSFARSGAALSDADKELYRKYTSELSGLTLRFGQNALAATNAFTLNITDPKVVAELPAFVREGMAAEAKARGEKGWTVTLQHPSYLPFMTYSSNRELKEKLWKASNSRALGGEFDNTEIVKKIANTRLKIANLLGYKCYADYVLERRMAENTKTVNDFLAELLAATKSYADADYRTVSDYAATLGFKGQLMPWDWSYYTEKYKDEKYALNDELVKPYLKLENVKKGVFMLANKLYGLNFTPDDKIEVYHPDVTAYDVTDADGRFMAVLYLDFFPRESKRSGAWMTEFRGTKIEDGKEIRPLVSLVMNFTKPTETAPSLLTFDELETFLHEFGHALHGMLGEGKYESQTGTNVYRDFVELPSQLMENWATEKEFLDLWAVHYETGEPMPAEIVDRIVAAQNYLAAYANVRQLSFGMTDMAYAHRAVRGRRGAVRSRLDGPDAGAARRFRNGDGSGFRPHLLGRLRRRILRLQVGRGARGRRFLALQGEGHLQPRGGFVVPRERPREGRHGAPDGTLRAFPRPQARNPRPHRKDGSGKISDPFTDSGGGPAQALLFSYPGDRNGRLRFRVGHSDLRRRGRRRVCPPPPAGRDSVLQPSGFFVSLRLGKRIFLLTTSMLEKSNAALIEAIHAHTPQHSNPASLLMDMLNIGREAAYRRLRGEVPFTFGEASALCARMHFSLDRVVGLAATDKLSFQLKFKEFTAPLETYNEILERDIAFMREVASDPTTEFATATNSLPAEFYGKYDNLNRFKLFKWLYQHEVGNPAVRTFEELKLPAELQRNCREYVRWVQSVATTYLIFDDSNFKHWLNALRAYREMHLISQESVRVLRDELFAMLDEMETVAVKGEFENGNKIFLYLSDIDLESSYSYVTTSRHQAVNIGMFSLNGLRTPDPLMYEYVKKWIKTQSRFSTLISGSGELRRIHYFKRQREIVAQLG